MRLLGKLPLVSVQPPLAGKFPCSTSSTSIPHFLQLYSLAYMYSCNPPILQLGISYWYLRSRQEAATSLRSPRMLSCGVRRAAASSSIAARPSRALATRVKPPRPVRPRASNRQTRTPQAEPAGTAGHAESAGESEWLHSQERTDEITRNEKIIASIAVVTCVAGKLCSPQPRVPMLP